MCVSPLDVADLAQELGRAGRAGSADVLWLTLTDQIIDTRSSTNSLYVNCYFLGMEAVEQEVFESDKCLWRCVTDAGSNRETKGVQPCYIRHSTIDRFCSNCQNHQAEHNNLVDEVDSIYEAIENYNCVMTKESRDVVTRHCRSVGDIVARLNDVYVRDRFDCVVHDLAHPESTCHLIKNVCFVCGGAHFRSQCNVVAYEKFDLRINVHLVMFCYF